MTGRVYLLNLDAYRDIREWCRRSPRHEVGGVLGGVGRYIQHAVRVPNTSPTRTSSYEWDSAAIREARAEVRELDLRVIGYWHSHPAGYARPSHADVACQSGLELIWSGIQARPRLWTLRGTRRQALRSEHELLVCQPARLTARRWP